MNLARRAALRSTLFSLHVSAVFAGSVSVLVWAAFRYTPAALVGGLAYALGGVVALLAFPRTFARARRVILMRALRVYVYAMALLTVGALLARDGARPGRDAPPAFAAPSRGGAGRAPQPWHAAASSDSPSSRWSVLMA